MYPAGTDHFLFFCQQTAHIYGHQYLMAMQMKNSDGASYWRGKVDAYTEIQRHYIELRGPEKEEQPQP